MNTEFKKPAPTTNQSTKLQKNHAGFDHRHADGQAFSWMLSIQKNRHNQSEDQVRLPGQ